MFKILRDQKKITSLLPPPSLSSRNFNPSQRCSYHSGAPGHDTQDCWSLKHKIQNLIDSGEIVIASPDQPNVQANPLPQHKEENVNTISSESTDSSLPEFSWDFLKDRRGKTDCLTDSVAEQEKISYSIESRSNPFLFS